MRSFLQHSVLFVLIILTLIGGYCLMYRTYFPAPRLTFNVSLNEQMRRVKKIKEGEIPTNPGGKVNMLAVGSSMSLNNLNSQAVLEHFGDSNFVNTGAWGMRIDQTTELTAALLDILQPRTVILTSNMMDWMIGPEYFKLDTAMLRDYLIQWGPMESYLRTLRASYYLREMELNKKRMNDPTHFDFLGFDSWGGASINVPPERVEPERNTMSIPTASQINEKLYHHLEWLAQHLHQERVEFIYIRSPFRERDKSPELLSVIADHDARIQKILEPYGHTFISTEERSWPDELFLDPSHFKEKGAYMFTQYALGKLEHGKPSPLNNWVVGQVRTELARTR